MATETYTLEYVARIEKLQAELAKIPGATDKSALAAAQRLEARLEKGARSAGAKIEAGIGGPLKKLAMGLGFGGIAGDIEDIADGLGGVSTALGSGAVAAGGAAVAIAGTTYALYRATAQTGALKEESAALDIELAKLAENAGRLMPGAFEAGTEKAADFVRGLDAMVTGVKAVIGVTGELANETIDELLLAYGNFQAQFGQLEEYLVDSETNQRNWADAWTSRRGFVGAMEDGYDATVKANQALVENRLLLEAQKAYKPQGPLVNPSDRAEFDRLVDAQEKRDAAAKKAAEEARQRHEKAVADAQRLAEIKTAFHDKERRWEEEADAALTAQITAESAALAQAAQARAEQHDQAIAFQIAEAEAYDVIIGKLRDQREESIASANAQRDAWASSSADIAGSIGTLIGLLAEQEGVSKKTAKALVIAQKAAGIAQVGISTAVAIMQALASFGPAGPAVAAGYAATGIAQAAVIAATPLPSFHQGGQMQGDEGVAVVRKGERVVTERGARDYDQGLGDLNRGAGGGSGPTRVSFEGRDLDVMLARVVRQHGATRRELDSRRMTGAY